MLKAAPTLLSQVPGSEQDDGSIDLEQPQQQASRAQEPVEDEVICIGSSSDDDEATADKVRALGSGNCITEIKYHVF
jgi:hypothetical protein